jgi:hypothetical protein
MAAFTIRPAAKRIIAALMLTLVSPLAQGSLGRLDQPEIRILASHNRERAALGVGPLQWDEGLARDAAVWGERMVRLGYLVHSDAPQGENLWAGTRGYYSIEAMVGLWADEKKHYKPGVFPANSRTGNLADVGHYTQLVWRETRNVGCAITQGKHDDFLVCRYSSPGNVIGERPF